MWTMPVSSVRFAPRDIPLPVVRVASMFAPKHEDEKPSDIAEEEGKSADAVVDKVSSIWRKIHRLIVLNPAILFQRQGNGTEKGYV